MTVQELRRLFDEAKAKNEFEFVRTLISYKGAGSKLFGSNVFEWFDAIENYEQWYKQPHNSLHEKGRFSLLIYSTFFELSDLYFILGNLSRIVAGYRATPYLYWKHEKENRWYGAAERISLIEELLIDGGFESLQKFFRENHYEQIRHAFFHSTYAFDEDEYILNDVETLYIDYVGHHHLSLTHFIFPRVESILEFFHCFKDLFVSQIRSYTENKMLACDLPGIASVEILGSQEGLTGFKDSADNAITLKTDVWTGANANFDLPSEVDAYIDEELHRFSKKTKISSDDGALQHLYEVISERNIQVELEKLGTIYASFGDMLFTMSSNEQNHFKMFKLREITQRFYNKMSDLNPALKFHVNKSLLKYVTAPSNEDGIKQSKEALTELLGFLKVEVRKDVLTNVSVILTRLKQNGVDIETEKKAFAKILLTKIPPELTQHAAQIAIDVNKL